MRIETNMPELNGSGERAMQVNQAALAEIEKQMAALRERAAGGEIVDGKIGQLVRQQRRLQKDRVMINQADM